MKRSRREPEGSPRRRSAPICLAGILLASLACAPVAAAEVPSFCGERYVRDYAAPLREMPRQHPPPEGELPFGPRNFGIHRINRTPLAFEGSRFGYRFGGKHEGARVLDLGWRAVAVARAVDRRGRVRRTVGERRWQVERIKDLDALEIAFPADHPGFFRIDLRIETLDGRRRVAYRDYFRVLRRSSEVGIRVSAESVHPGEPVWGLLENPGAGQLSTRGYLDLERYEGDAWVPVPLPPTPRSVMGIGWIIGPGEVGWCQRFDVPADAAPGSYRFSTPVNLANTQKRVLVTGAFVVSP
ncbi:MAG TPA: hypothetical protein VFY75_09020 [Solirubrobacterales bacterium]|nr:hypothetical protein [Solirubrobacterales bacterium]